MYMYIIMEFLGGGEIPVRPPSVCNPEDVLPLAGIDSIEEFPRNSGIHIILLNQILVHVVALGIINDVFSFFHHLGIVNTILLQWNSKSGQQNSTELRVQVNHCHFPPSIPVFPTEKNAAGW